MNKTILLHSLLLTLFVATSCKEQPRADFVFPEKFNLTTSDFPIDRNSLGRIEGLQGNDSLLITWDYHSGTSFSLFNNKNGEYYGRFGDIGEGPTDIPLPCGGFFVQDKYKIFSCSTGFIAQYDLDSLCNDITQKPSILCRRNFTDDFFLSSTIPVNDSLYLGAGVYQSEYQYVLFNKEGIVVDANVFIYNATNPLFEKAHKILSNQGRLAKCPTSNKYAFILNNSANIDFIEVKNDKIEIIKLLRKRDPVYTQRQESSMKIVYPDRDNLIGYIDVTAGEKFVYALYSDKTITNNYCSKVLYVFDWEGNPRKEYQLSYDAYYIAVDECHNYLFTAAKDPKDEGWTILKYIMK